MSQETKIEWPERIWTPVAEKAFLEPLKRKKPTVYFVNSMGDLFHEDMPDEWIDRAFAVMAVCPQHTFQVLAKRADRMRDYISAQRGINGVGEAIRALAPKSSMSVGDAARQLNTSLKSPWWPLPNVWLGVSIEDQKQWNERWPHLARTPAAVRFVSAEPLSGPIDMIGAGKLDWVICGGESGPNARPMHPDWVRGLRDQSKAIGASFFFKQHESWLHESQAQKKKLISGLIPGLMGDDQ